MQSAPAQVADENVPPAAAAGGASKKQKASNIRTSWGGAASRRALTGSTQATGTLCTAISSEAVCMMWHRVQYKQQKF